MKTWEDFKAENNIEIAKIESALEYEKPQSISDVLREIYRIVPDWKALPNPNQKGQYCQVVLYPPSGFTCSISVTKYELYN